MGMGEGYVMKGGLAPDSSMKPLDFYYEVIYAQESENIRFSAIKEPTEQDVLWHMGYIGKLIGILSSARLYLNAFDLEQLHCFSRRFHEAAACLDYGVNNLGNHVSPLSKIFLSGLHVSRYTNNIDGSEV